MVALGAAASLGLSGCGGGGAGASGHVYWVNARDGTVNKVPLGGGKVTALATSQNYPESVAVTGTHVCWVNFLDGTVN